MTAQSMPYTVVTPASPQPQFQLTVVTVCWNALDELRPTVESVLRQKAKGSLSIEHVVVDGASTDGTPEWLASQLAADNIEHYISEPDRGIYDAMNKGINLARGQVLAFLNAGDTYTDEDLAPCVLPICRGDTYGVAACAYRHDVGMGPDIRPSYDQLFFYCPCSHQAYFASARAYREIGGYDSHGLRCSADANMMYDMYRKWGMPRVLERHVADFAAAGMSANCDDDFRDENVELLWRNWDLIERRSLEDEDFKAVMEAFLVNHCLQFRDWQQRHGKMIPDTLGKLQSLCRRLAKHAHSLFAKCALRWLAGRYLPVLVSGRECSPLLLRIARFWSHACYIPEQNQYKESLWLPNKPLSSHTLLNKFFPAKSPRP